MAAPPSTAPLEEANWAVERALALPEVWGLVADHIPSLVAKWRLLGVCKASRVGVKESLGTLPGVVVCGGRSSQRSVSGEVWRLDLATMQWEPMPGLVTARLHHACCAVRGSLVVLGGRTYSSEGYGSTSSVEMLSSEEGVFAELPPLSCGAIEEAVAIPVEESDSALGQVLLLGGEVSDAFGGRRVSTVRLVDLATGVCTPAQVPDLLLPRSGFTAQRLPDGRYGCIVCLGGGAGDFWESGEVYGPLDLRATDAAWTWRQLPSMSVARGGSRGCVMSDGRFAVLGGWSPAVGDTSSCETLVTSADNEHWEPLPHMHDLRYSFVCEAVAGCIIVAGGNVRQSSQLAEVYDEVLGRWYRLPRDLPNVSWLRSMGSALM
jgi:hypothetical protein